MAAGTVWSNGQLQNFAPHRTDSSDIDLSLLSSSSIAEKFRAVDPFKIIPPSAYPLHKMQGRTWVRCFPTQQGIELVVPHWEIIRNWYLFDPYIIPGLLAGGVDNVNTLSTSHQLWQPHNSRLIKPNGAIFVHHDRLTRETALRLARLVLDPVARRKVNYLSQMIHGQPDRTSIPFPPVPPPFNGAARWDYDYVQLPTEEHKPERRLVLRITRSNDALPYDWIDVHPIHSFRQAPNAADDLPRVRRNTLEIELPDDGTVDLYGDGPNPGLAAAEIGGLSFASTAVEVERRELPKAEQSHRSGGGEAAHVVTSSLSVDPTADSDPSLASQAGQVNAAPPTLDRDTEQIVNRLDMIDLFSDVIDQTIAHPDLQGWSGKFLGDVKGSIKAYNPELKVSRPFLILHFFNAVRNVYVLEAGHLKPYERYRVRICERRFGGRLSEQHLAKWLGSFPAKQGDPWLTPEGEALNLIWNLKGINHQPFHVGDTLELVRQKFLNRLTQEITKFIVR